jgi:two-component system OmpR family response regulator
MPDRTGPDAIDFAVAIRERILIVEDEPEFSTELAGMLRRHGFDVGVVNDLTQMAESVSKFEPTILILDQFVHEIDMLPRLAQIRMGFKGGLMVLTGNSDVTDRVLALEHGADDFVLKTTHPREVLARLRALARRSATTGSEPCFSEGPHGPGPDGWTVDHARREVRTPNGDVPALTGLEFDAFRMLHQMPGKIVSRESLAKEILQRHVCASGRSIENLISRVRAKFAPHVGSRPLIRSVRGKGYVFLGFP